MIAIVLFLGRLLVLLLFDGKLLDKVLTVDAFLLIVASEVSIFLFERVS